MIWSLATDQCWGQGGASFLLGYVFISATSFKGKSSSLANYEEVCPWPWTSGKDVKSRGTDILGFGKDTLRPLGRGKNITKSTQDCMSCPQLAFLCIEYGTGARGVRPARQLKSSQERILAPFSKPFCFLTENRVSQTTILRIAFEPPGLWKQESLPESLLIFLRLL